MEERPVLLLIVMLFYFFVGPVTLLSAVVHLLRGASLLSLAPGVIVAPLVSVCAFAAWRHRRWGYLGVLAFGAWTAIRANLVAYRFGWDDVQSNLIAVFASALFAPMIVHRRVYASSKPQ